MLPIPIAFLISDQAVIYPSGKNQRTAKDQFYSGFHANPGSYF